jgi:hypothetical protein
MSTITRYATTKFINIFSEGMVSYKLSLVELPSLLAGLAGGDAVDINPAVGVTQPTKCTETGVSQES